MEDTLCKFCGLLVLRGNLSRHLESHGENKRCCQICQTKFKTNNSLMQHMKIHTEPKQFNCPECTKVSSSKTGLKFHIEANHRAQKYTCEKCSKAFKRKYCLQRHEKFFLNESKEKRKHFEATCYTC